MTKYITTQDYLLFVNTRPEEGINPQVQYFNDKVDENNIYRSVEMFTEKVTYYCVDGIKEGNITLHQIIAHLPLNNAPVLEGVPLLPELPKQEEEIENLKWEKVKNISPEFKGAFLLGFENGYEVVSKKWSDEDMIDMFVAGFHYEPRKIEALDDAAREELKTFKSPTSPVNFIPEKEWSSPCSKGVCKEEEQIVKNMGEGYVGIDICSDGCVWATPKLKIVNGIVQGKYVYA